MDLRFNFFVQLDKSIRYLELILFTLSLFSFSLPITWITPIRFIPPLNHNYTQFKNISDVHYRFLSAIFLFNISFFFIAEWAKNLMIVAYNTKSTKHFINFRKLHSLCRTSFHFHTQSFLAERPTSGISQTQDLQWNITWTDLYPCTKTL